MPGVGVRTAARILLDVGDASQFPTAGHLAAYAGLAPVTRRSGTSIRGEFPARSGNKHLKRALFLSAFAALRSDPTSKAYYDRKRARARSTTPPSSACHADAVMSCSPCSRTGSPTGPPPQRESHHPCPSPLDGEHRDTPRTADSTPLQSPWWIGGGENDRCGWSVQILR